MMNRLHIIKTIITAFLAFMLSVCWNLAIAGDKLLFMENKGQITDQFGAPRPDIDFKLKAANGLNIFLANGVIHYQWAKASGEPVDAEPVETYRMDVRLLGANLDARVTYDDKQAYYERYYLPSVGMEGATAHSYRKVTYRNVYPNIDWVFYFNADGKLEHDFIVRPGGDPAQIRLEYAGAGKLQVNDDGGLTATTPFGIVTENAPISFLQHDKQPVASAFALNGNILSFSVADYTGTLIIDPTLDWATYFGDVLYDETKKLATGSDGSVYAVGSTSNTDNIATTGAHQVAFGGGSSPIGADAFLARFNSGGECLWATYYGGEGIDLGRSVTLDTTGFIYIAGQTNSAAGIATMGAHQQTLGGDLGFEDAFVTKFDTSGQRVWGTYFGGENQDGTTALDIHSDNSNRIYLVGRSASETGVATPGAFQASKAGPSPFDGFLAQFDDAGNQVWSTYYGGESEEVLYAVTSDTSGNIFIGGNSSSNTGIATAGTHQPAFGGGINDGFIAKFDAVGQRIWATYFGGDALDIIWSLACDPAGNIYAGGTTQSASGIATNDAHQASLSGAQDIFLVRLDASGQMEWSTYYGGQLNESFPSVCIGMDGKVYLSGAGNSSDGIATADGLNTALNGGSFDGFLAYFSTDGTREWGTYLGGNSVDQNYTLAGDQSGNFYLGGRTSSTLDLATAEGYQTNFGGSYDGFILKINTCELLPESESITGPLTICEGAEITYHASSVEGATDYLWILPEGWIGSSTADSITVIIGASSGELAVAGTNHCGPGDTASITVTVNPLPQPQISRNGNVLNTTQAYNTYQWNHNAVPIPGATDPTCLITANGEYTVTVTDGYGCEGTSEAFNVGDVGIADLLLENGIHVYPNPVGDRLHLVAQQPVTLTIHTALGQLVYYNDLKAGNTVIETSVWATGVYLIQVNSLEGVSLGAGKLLKQD